MAEALAASSSVDALFSRYGITGASATTSTFSRLRRKRTGASAPSLSLSELRRIVLPPTQQTDAGDGIDSMLGTDDPWPGAGNEYGINHVKSGKTDSTFRSTGRSAKLHVAQHQSSRLRSRPTSAPLDGTASRTSRSGFSSAKASPAPPYPRLDEGEDSDSQSDVSLEGVDGNAFAGGAKAGAEGQGGAAANRPRRGGNPFVAYEDRELRLQWERRWLQEDPEYMAARHRGLLREVACRRRDERMASDAKSTFSVAFPHIQQSATKAPRQGDRKPAAANTVAGVGRRAVERSELSALRTMQRDIVNSSQRVEWARSGIGPPDRSQKANASKKTLSAGLTQLLKHRTTQFAFAASQGCADEV